MQTSAPSDIDTIRLDRRLKKVCLAGVVFSIFLIIAACVSSRTGEEVNVREVQRTRAFALSIFSSVSKFDGMKVRNIFTLLNSLILRFPFPSPGQLYGIAFCFYMAWCLARKKVETLARAWAFFGNSVALLIFFLVSLACTADLINTGREGKNFAEASKIIPDSWGLMAACLVFSALLQIIATGMFFILKRKLLFSCRNSAASRV